MAGGIDWDIEEDGDYEGPDAIIADGDEGIEVDDIEDELEDDMEREALEEDEVADGGESAIQQILAAMLASRTGRRVVLSEQARDLLATLQVRRVQVDNDDDDDDGEWNPRAIPPHTFAPATEPQPAGVKLLQGGEFGPVGLSKSSQQMPKLLASRESRPWRTSRRELVSHIYPNTAGTVVAKHAANVYSGQFSADSSFYYTCRQDFRLHVYQPTAPFQFGDAMHSTPEHTSTMKVLKTIRAVQGGWTITDSHLSPDNQRLIYSAMSSVVHMTKTLEDCVEQTPLDFSDPGRNSYLGRFAVWSCRFSADAKEIIAGGSTQLFVYDLEANRRTVKIPAHQDDVNSCCWADTASGNVLVSASDDTFIKVWDRRSLGAHPRPSGVLIGHTEGITSVSAKGDGRYVISNGKDQALRLWDLRYMRSNSEYEEVRQDDYSIRGFDYRAGRYSAPRVLAHPRDCSVMTYRGHKVLRTLIRCHFSPVETTGARYIYSGSYDGRIHIWSLDGQLVQVLDRADTLPMSSQLGDTRGSTPKGPSVVVRDVAWSSSQPVMMSCAWEGHHTGGSTIARHEFRGLHQMGGRLEDVVEAEQAANTSAENPTSQRSRFHVSGAWEV